MPAPEQQPNIHKFRPGVDAAAAVRADLEQERIAKSLWTKTGDVMRDIKTASDMAKDKFEGDSALMRTAKGFVSTGVGVGLEKSMDFVWDKIWQGDIPYYDKTKFGEGMAEAMNRFARKSDLTARLNYFIKESTQDMTMAIFYNFLAFRSQPLLEKAKPTHLLRSLYTNAIAATALPSLPQQMRYEAAESTNSIIGKKQEALQDKMDQLMRSGRYNNETHEFDYPQATDDRINELHRQIGSLGLKYYSYDNDNNVLPPVPGKVEQVFLTAFDLSNPVTQLGVDMIGSGIQTLVKNFGEVRKMREAKGGLPGKQVFVPRPEGPKPSFDRRNAKPGFSKPEYTKSAPKKVFYGQSDQDDLKRLEEYDLKGS